MDDNEEERVDLSTLVDQSVERSIESLAMVSQLLINMRTERLLLLGMIILKMLDTGSLEMEIDEKDLDSVVDYQLHYEFGETSVKVSLEFPSKNDQPL